MFHDHRIAVSGSTNVQIGNANQQTVTLDIGKLIAAINNSDATDGEKREARGLIEKLTTNPLVLKVFETVLGILRG